MIQIDRETFQMMLHQIMERFDKIEDKLGRMNRQKKLVTYYMIDGRTYYKSSEVKEFLNRKGRLSLAEMERNKINV